MNWRHGQSSIDVAGGGRQLIVMPPGEFIDLTIPIAPDDPHHGSRLHGPEGSVFAVCRCADRDRLAKFCRCKPIAESGSNRNPSMELRAASSRTNRDRFLHCGISQEMLMTVVPLPRGPAIGPLRERRMRVSGSSPLFHISDGRLQIEIGQADTEIYRQHIAKCSTAADHATIHFARREVMEKAQSCVLPLCLST
jgi:hypothetical protein